LSSPKAKTPHRARRLARERALQFLYGIAFTEDAWEPALDAFWDSFPARDAVRAYAESLVEGIHTHVDAIDEAITGAIEHWTPGRVGQVEWAILRVAVYEMRYPADVPAGVAINEAIELAKKYGADDAPRFINGVLDRIKKAGLLISPETDVEAGI